MSLILSFVSGQYKARILAFNVAGLGVAIDEKACVLGLAKMVNKINFAYKFF